MLEIKPIWLAEAAPQGKWGVIPGAPSQITKRAAGRNQDREDLLVRRVQFCNNRYLRTALFPNRCRWRSVRSWNCCQAKAVVIVLGLLVELNSDESNFPRRYWLRHSPVPPSLCPESIPHLDYSYSLWTQYGRVFSNYWRWRVRRPTISGAKISRTDYPGLARRKEA